MAAEQSAAPATLIRTLPTAARAVTPTVGEGDDVKQEDVDRLLEQQGELQQAVDRLATRMDSVASKAEGAWVDMNGLMGNDGVKATQARLLESHRGTRRELRITRRQIQDGFESLRAEIRSLREESAAKDRATSEERVAERLEREAVAKKDQRSWFERGAYVLAALSVTGAGGVVVWWVWWAVSRELGVR